MFSWYERMKNSHKMPPRIVKFSFFLIYYGCSQPIWKLLSRLQLSLSYEKTRQLLFDCVKVSVPKQLGWIDHQTIFVIGADNCAYYNAHTYTQDSTTSLFMNTINWYHRFWKNDFNSMLQMDDDLFSKDYIDNKLVLR